MSRIRRIFKHASANELIDSSVLDRLKCVAPLLAGRTEPHDKAVIERWVSHQLRHTNADAVRKEFGLEHTQAVLGHAKANMSEHYAKARKAKAAEVARKIGWRR